MARFLFPIIFLGIAIGLFYTYISPTREKVYALETQNARLDEALTKSKELEAARDSLLSKFNTFSKKDQERLQKMLPDHIDNIRLIIDIENIAATYGLTIHDFGFTENTTASPSAGTPTGGNSAVQGAPVSAVQGSSKPYGTVQMKFTVDASYNDFLSFSRDLEKSLRLVDIVSISLSNGGAGTTATKTADKYAFDVVIQTYWLH